MKPHPVYPFKSSQENYLLHQTISVAALKLIMAHNHPTNRKRSNSRQLALQRDIRSGKYRSDVGHCLKFNVLGDLIDGQHRVLAHIAENTPLVINVHVGLPVDAILYIDRNRSRSLATNVTLIKGLQTRTQPGKEAFSNDRAKISVATWILNGLWWAAGNGSNKPYWPDADVLGTLVERKSVIEHVLNGEIQRFGILGAFALYFDLHPTKAEIFFRAVNGSEFAVAHSPTATLREYLVTSSSGGSAPIWDYFNAVRCINAFHFNKAISRLELSNKRADFAF